MAAFSVSGANELVKRVLEESKKVGVWAGLMQGLEVLGRLLHLDNALAQTFEFSDGRKQLEPTEEIVNFGLRC